MLPPIFILCNNNCGSPSGDLPVAINECDTDGLQTTGMTFIIAKCDWIPTDITDPVEWAAAIASNDIVVAPRGFWSKAAATVTNFDITCGRKKQVQEGQQIVFNSSLVVASTAEEQEFYKELRERVSNYRFIPVSCNEDGTLDYWVTDEYVENPTVPGQSPGHVGTWIQPPDNIVLEGPNNLLSYTFTIQFPVSGILCRRKLPLIDAEILP